MKHFLIYFFTAVLIPNSIHAAPATEFDDANKAYSAGHYTEAIADYEKITVERGYSTAVLFNLANAYEKSGSPGMAILNYERALRLSPRDPDIQANLKLARTEAQVPLPVKRWWRDLLDYFRPEEWELAASLLFAIFCLVWAARLLKPDLVSAWGGISQVKMWRLLLFLLGVSTFIVIACFALSLQERDKAVILTKEAPLLVAPYDKASAIISLPEGETVNAEKKHDHFVYVRYRKGDGGWIDEKQIGFVTPPS